MGLLTSAVRKCLGRRWSCCMWIIICLLIAGVAVQNIFIFQAGKDWLDASKENTSLRSLLQNVWRSRQFEPVPQPSRPAHLPRENPGSPNPESDDSPESRNKTVQNASTCQPKLHIVFLKTHKTGSSTIQNVLYRYGDGRNLTFALPRKRNHRFFYPMVFQSVFVEGVSGGGGFNIMCNHMRFRKSEVSKVMPKDTFYFSILRHPVPMMESMFMYFRGLAGSSKSQSLDEFLDHKWTQFQMPKHRTDRRDVTDFSHNNLAFDLGFDNSLTANAPDLQERAERDIAAIERDFNLILINEYFDESMVLLKSALCWSLEDVVSFKLNGRSDQSRQAVPTETAEKIQRWNALDWKIYLHFNATFWEQMRTWVGGEEEVKREVAELRELQAKLTETCLGGGEAVNPSQIEEAGLKPFQGRAAVILGYNLKPDLDKETHAKCRKLITPELQYTLYLYNRQRKR